MFRGDWGNTTNKQMPRIGNTDSWHFCKVWPHLPCLLLMCPYKLSRDSKYFILDLSRKVQSGNTQSLELDEI